MQPQCRCGINKDVGVAADTAVKRSETNQNTQGVMSLGFRSRDTDLF